MSIAPGLSPQFGPVGVCSPVSTHPFLADNRRTQRARPVYGYLLSTAVALGCHICRHVSAAALLRVSYLSCAILFTPFIFIMQGIHAIRGRITHTKKTTFTSSQEIEVVDLPDAALCKAMSWRLILDSFSLRRSYTPARPLGGNPEGPKSRH